MKAMQRALVNSGLVDARVAPLYDSNIGVTLNGNKIESGHQSGKTTSKKAAQKTQGSFEAENGAVHTALQSGVAFVRINSRARQITIPDDKTVLQFAVWIHYNENKTAINFFGFDLFNDLKKGDSVLANVEIWQKATKHGQVYRYVNFKPTKAKKPSHKLGIGHSSVDDELVRLTSV